MRERSGGRGHVIVTKQQGFQWETRGVRAEGRQLCIPLMPLLTCRCSPVISCLNLLDRHRLLWVLPTPPELI